MVDVVAAKQEITDAIGAHGTWKMRLQTAAQTGRLQGRAVDLARDDLCRFGQWLGGLPPEMAGTDTAREVKRLHREFHNLAGGVARQVEAGDTAGARATLETGQLGECSTQLARALTSWKMALR
ncbi:MAG: Methyl-accepting chemotaxis protein I (serine chemoreceptor protein) [Rhodobacteraceae bacterium HLUCCO07]|nr:MAG: Methyl-accepting chemotaxis protein I (serine chemoreceptor protein) [Rhodobacteraceae bacterium HLUCCO07]KPP93649.1 MAG: Chemoreceptor zinc-binding domain [Rhodobacteraceae bacterium HLUCCA08]